MFAMAYIFETDYGHFGKEPCRRVKISRKPPKIISTRNCRRIGAVNAAKAMIDWRFSAIMEKIDEQLPYGYTSAWR